MHTINILYLNRRISFINGDKYKKEYRKARELSCKKELAEKISDFSPNQFNMSFALML